MRGRLHACRVAPRNRDPGAPKQAATSGRQLVGVIDEDLRTDPPQASGSTDTSIQLPDALSLRIRCDGREGSNSRSSWSSRPPSDRRGHPVLGSTQILESIEPGEPVWQATPR